MAEAIFSDVFGRLTWDNHLGCWLGGIDWPLGRHTEVAIWQADEEVASALRRAGDGLDWLRTHEAHARLRIAAELAEVDTSWQDEEAVWEEFSRCLELIRIEFDEDGSLLLSYNPGELFGGQVLEAEFGPDRSFLGAGLIE
jgi:hypothetical protein